MSEEIDGAGYDAQEKHRDDKTGPELVKYWLGEHALYIEDQDSFRTRGLEILNRYTDERTLAQEGEDEPAKKAPIFFSTVELLKPIIFARVPKLVIQARNKEDRLYRKAAEILEDSSTHYLELQQDLKRVFQRVRDDFLLPGRGTARVRYEYDEAMVTERYPVYQGPDGGRVLADGTPIPDDIPVKVTQDPQSGEEVAYVEEQVNKIVFQEFKIEYVHWRSYLHNPARVEDDLRSEIIEHWYTEKEFKELFGKDVKCEGGSSSKDKEEDPRTSHNYQKNLCLEIWDAENERVLFISPGYKEKPLKVIDDPYELGEFFCTQSISAVQTNESLVPQGFYTMWQDQLRNVDDQTDRIDKLQDGIRVAGAYNKTLGDNFANILSKDNHLEAVENWGAIAEAGGLDAQTWFMDITPQVNALQSMYEVRERDLSLFYEASGVSDMMRGVTDPGETLGAQQLKARFSGNRVSEYQERFQEFAKNLLVKFCELISDKITPDTIKEMYGAKLTQDGYSDQDVERIVEILHDDTQRTFAIDIETDSTIALDEVTEQQQRLEMLDRVTSFMTKGWQFTQANPQFGAIFPKLMMYVLDTFRASRGLRDSFDEILDQIEQAQKQAQKQPPRSPPPDPKLTEIQERAKLEQFKMQSEMQKEQTKAAMEREKFQMNHALEMFKAENDRILAELAIVKARQEGENMAIETQRADNEAKEAEAELMLKAIDDRMQRQQQRFEKQMETYQALFTKTASESKNDGGSAQPPVFNLHVDATKSGRKIGRAKKGEDGVIEWESVDVPEGV